MGNRGSGGGPTSKWENEAWRGHYPACTYCCAGEREACVTPNLRRRKPHMERQWLIDDMKQKGKKVREDGVEAD